MFLDRIFRVGVLLVTTLCCIKMAEAQQPSWTDLNSEAELASPMPDAAFVMPAAAKPPSQTFEGTLKLTPPPGYGFGTIISTLFDSVRTDLTWKQLPAFSVDFVQSGNHLVPAEQGLIITGSVAWNVIVGVGAVWDQPGDHGYTRASLPFAIIERSQNCVHNGEMTFLFSNTKQPAISQVRYQITQETCYYMKVDMWGQIAASYTPHKLANAGKIKSEFIAEESHRVKSKPLSDLAKDFPAAHIDLAALLRGRKLPGDVTTYGVYVNGVHYKSNCPTRYGYYAFCDQMRLPSYSTAKSSFAAMAMMHLGEVYGSGVYSQKLDNYLPPVGQDKSWDDVSFTNALDMATGHYQTAGFEADEDGPETKFLVDESLDDKLKDALAFPYKTPPGTTWTYQSHSTFLSTVAMNNFLKKKQGASADLFNLVRKDIYKPLQLSQGMLTTIRTDDSPTGVPAGYFGLFFIQDDVVKLARFFNESHGMIAAKTVLDPQRLS
jgi:hypothetical protein